MCRLAIALDQSVHTLASVLDLVEASTFYVRSIRVAPIAWSLRADVYLSLGGGSKPEFDTLLSKLRELPAVQSTQHTLPSFWIAANSGLEEETALPRTERTRMRS